jgi:putative endonuclease
MEKRRYCIYILASDKNGTLYIGVTNNLAKRIYEHKNKIIKGFTEKYKVDKLVYYEIHGEVSAALYREKQLKKWNRQWKVELIEKENPGWTDLYNKII